MIMERVRAGEERRGKEVGRQAPDTQVARDGGWFCLVDGALMVLSDPNKMARRWLTGEGSSGQTMGDGARSMANNRDDKYGGAMVADSESGGEGEGDGDGDGDGERWLMVSMQRRWGGEEEAGAGSRSQPRPRFLAWRPARGLRSLGHVTTQHRHRTSTGAVTPALSNRQTRPGHRLPLPSWNSISGCMSQP